MIYDVRQLTNRIKHFREKYKFYKNADYNIVFGHCAGYCNNGGSRNVYIGRCINKQNDHGEDNVIIGHDAIKNNFNPKLTNS